MSASSPEADQIHLTKPDTSESPPPSPQADIVNQDSVVRDIMLWRRKQLNIVILLGATATWIAMEVYQYNFITLLSWLAIALVLCLFFWGSLHRILKKEAPDLSELEVKEERAIEHARILRGGAEAGIRMMLEMSIEKEWYVFAGGVASLYLIALLPTHLSFLTICYVGVLGGMSIPLIYVNKEQDLRKFAEKGRITSQTFYLIITNKLHRFRKQKEIIKEKKME